MNVTNQTEIIAPKSSVYANEVAAYPHSKLLDKSKIAPILHKKSIRIDCIVFAKKATKKQNLIDHKVMGVVIVADDKFKDYLSEIASFFSIKELKNKILLLDESSESKLILRRIINAYKIQAPSELIAKFSVYKEENDEVFLQITAADFTELTINPKTISALANMTYDQLLQFELEEYGFNVCWPKKDIHLNLESFKIVTDQKFMKKRMKEIEKDKKEFGALMKKYRESSSEFTQKDFGGISDRQIRKYENGENYPSTESLQTISATYGLTINDYFEKLAQMRNK
ncbi:MAG: helix-turn-helix domain-containing protein [Proteobacteria bacterium]|nr:helix-turn-helix domain-containing protein [Pseudomonadota bacterium]